MKKRSFFLLALLVVFVFACDLQTPKEIRILKETPELRFSATMDSFSLEDIFDMDFDFDFGPSVQILDCENVPVLTKLIYLELFDKDLSLDSSITSYISSVLTIAPGGYTINEPPDGRKIAETPTPVEITAPDLDVGFLKNINLKPLRTRLYISGSDPSFLNMLNVEISINDKKDKYSRSSSFVFPAGDDPGKYSGTNLPPCANEFFMPFDDDLEIKLGIFIKDGEIIGPGFLSKGLDIKVELGIWLPFEFGVGSGGAEFDLPFDELFVDGGDLFGRSSATDESFIVDALIYLFLEIVLDHNPFPNATLVVESNSKTIKSSITGNALRIHIDKDDVGYPFIPKFSIEFEEGNTILVPREFTIKELAFKAKLKLVIDVAGEDS